MRFYRLTGLAGIAFVVLVGGFNVLLVASGPPLNDAEGADIAAYLMNNNAVMTTVTVVAPLIWVSLLVLGIGVFARVQRTDAERGGSWGALGLVGVLLICAMFSIASGTYVALNLGADSLAANPTVTEMIWRFNRAMFTLTARDSQSHSSVSRWPSNARDYLDTARAGWIRRRDLVARKRDGGDPRGQRQCSRPARLAGFVIWLGWVVTVSIRLLKEASQTATATGTTAAQSNRLLLPAFAFHSGQPESLRQSLTARTEVVAFTPARRRCP